MMLDPKALNLPWTTESDLPYGEQPRIYDATGALVAVVGNAETEKQDDWERNASAIVSAVNALSSLTPADVGGLVERLRVRWEATDEPTAKKINRTLLERKEAADRLEALEAIGAQKDAEIARLTGQNAILDSDGIAARKAAANNLARAEASEAALAEARKALEQIERKICAAEHGHTINDVLANYREVRRTVQDARAARRVREGGK